MANSSEFGLYVPSTYIWDISQLSALDIDPELKELLVRLYQNINAITISLNIKDSGYYDTNEFVNGQLLFPNPILSSSSSTVPTYRQIYRIVINFGTLPNAGSTSIAHNIPISTGYTFTRIYGSASDPVNLEYIPLPYSSPTLINNIELSVNATNITVTTGSNRSNFTVTYIILEYIKF